MTVINDFLIGGAAVVLLFALMAVIDGWVDRRKVRKHDERYARVMARIARNEEAQRKRLDAAIQWEDPGLDVTKLEVKHVPYKGE